MQIHEQKFDPNLFQLIQKLQKTHDQNHHYHHSDQDPENFSYTATISVLTVYQNSNIQIANPFCLTKPKNLKLVTLVQEVYIF